MDNELLSERLIALARELRNRFVVVGTGHLLGSRGIPALLVTDPAYFRNRNYHGPGDRAETLDYVFMVELVHSLGLALDGLAATR